MERVPRNEANDSRGRMMVLLRHGSSAWNLSGRFTGWTDIDLSDTGIAQATRAGLSLKAAGITFDEVHTSVLHRTRQTADVVLAAMHHTSIPRYETWRLNERHYGQLQGKDKSEIHQQWGEERCRRWWRGYHEPPPALDQDDPRHPRFDPLYAALDPALLPRGESLRDCQLRLLPWWREAAQPALQTGRNLLVVSHGNIIRSFVMHLENIAPDAIEKVEIPSGVPLLYCFDSAGEIVEKAWLE